jgi:hypothetical protein
MGSRARHSSGRKAASLARKGKRSPARRKTPESPSLDFHTILGRFSDALAIVATAASALDAAQDRTAVEVLADPGDLIFCLLRGVRELRRVYNELDVAIMEGGS